MGGRPGSSTRVRTVAPSAVAPGSAVDTAPTAPASSTACVDLPQPSTPSRAMSRPRPLTPFRASPSTPSSRCRLSSSSPPSWRCRLLRRVGLLGGAAFLAPASWRAGFLADLAAFDDFVALAARPARFDRRARGPAIGEQLGGALDGDRLGLVALAQRGVGGAVGHVGPESARAHHDRRRGLGVLAQLPERRRRARPAARLGLGEQSQRLVEGDRQQLLLGLEAAGVGALLHIRPEAAVEGLDLLARRRVGAHRPGQAQQLERLVQADGLGRHRLEERRRPGPLATVDRLAELDVGAEAARAHEHGETAVGIGAQGAVPRRRRQQLLRLAPR